MPFPKFLFLCLAITYCSANAQASDVTVTVVDREGEPVPDVAVYVEAMSAHDAAPDGTRAVMDQVDKRFVPHLLVVQKGTLVEFPNSDPIGHHVYSFSDPNGFMLPLYKGDAHPPVRFEHPGIVTVGCNIHDGMLAYIVVVDGPTFGLTDRHGTVVLAGSEGHGRRVGIWSPRIRARGETLAQDVSGPEVTFRLQGTLRPAHDDGSGGIEWSDY